MTRETDSGPSVQGTQGFMRGLLDSARENPTSAALIGAGLLWMVLGRDGGSVLGKVRGMGQTAATGLGAGGRKVGAGVSSMVASVADKVSDGLDTMTDHASDVGTAASRRVVDGTSSLASSGSKAFEAVGDGVRAQRHDARDLASNALASASEGGGHAAEHASNLVSSLRSGFADVLQRQPLVIGAIGLAIGAGVAAALPRIAAEDGLSETIGGLKQSVREGLSGAYTRASNEARAQGLTPEAASRAVSEIGDTAKGVAKSTVEDAKGKLS